MADDPNQQWQELCDEFRQAQERSNKARRQAFQNGRFASAEGIAAINAAAEEEEAIKRRMDEFMERHLPGSTRPRT